MQQTQSINTDRLNQSTSQIRHNWDKEEIIGLLEKPFNDLIYQAHMVHREYFDPNEVQLSTLLNIKSGGCPEDCAYCPQSARYNTPIEAEPLTELDDVINAAKKAREIGATRFCMGGAWRSPKEKDFQKVLDMVASVKELGMETCATLGMLTREQAHRLKQSGLDYYNHNLDTSEEYYSQIISTRTFEDRLKTLSYVRDAGMNVCCGGIIGMGEQIQDRAGMLQTLANMNQHPESVPINMLVKVTGTPLENEQDSDPLDTIRMIAVTRIIMPASYVRLSAGRNDMSVTHQALCFFAGANSIFYGEKLLTTDNPDHQFDKQLFDRLGIKAKR